MEGEIMRQACGLQLRTMLTASALAAFSLAQFAHATTISGDLTVDNAFYAYISTSNSSLGTLVASGNNWGATFSFSSFALTPGQTYYLQIEGINYGGPGAFIGDFTLSDAGFQFANGTQTLLTDITDWSASFNDTNSDPSTQQPWVTPTGGVVSEGANGVSPWGTRSGISGSADWIDGATNGLTTCVNCTVDFSAVITPNITGVPEPGTLGLLLGGFAGVGLIRSRRGSA
jgi:hypothetical protein